MTFWVTHSRATEVKYKNNQLQLLIKVYFYMLCHRDPKHKVSFNRLILISQTFVLIRIYARNEQSYKCMFCNKQFQHSGSLNRHIRTHTKEKPYKCDINDCKKSFSQKSNLDKHKETHFRTKKPHNICHICGTITRNYSMLEKHMQIHV